MKKISFIFLLIFMVSCSSSKSTVQQNTVDSDLDVLIAKIQKKTRASDVENLAVIWKQSNGEDLNEIKNLKVSGQPNIWDSVYGLYNNLDQRQQKVEVLTSEVLGQIGFLHVDYSKDIQSSREKAAIYYYALANKKLDSGNKEDLPEAIKNLQSVQRIYPGFKDVDELLATLIPPVKELLYYKIELSFPYDLPPGSSEELSNMDLSSVTFPAYRFVSQKPAKDEYKYYVEFTITHVKISPERTGELSYTESAEMQDGIAYKLNANGDFILDSLGHKIEIPRFNTLVCYVNEYLQEKSMKVIGTVQVINRDTGKTLAMKNVAGESKFSNVYAKFKGDMDALSPETFKLVGSKEMDYPDDALMISHASGRLIDNAVKIVAGVLDNVEN